VPDFARKIVAWQRKHGRHDLPWQRSRDPYRVWLAEVMLQQTQVQAVIPYYQRFLARFRGVWALASAPQDEVLRLWSGLGYYARARNLHAAARVIARQYSGRFPGTAAQLQALPGVGRSTAAAIAAFAFGERAAILDGNVKRLLARCFGVAGYPGERAVEARLWRLAESLLPRSAIAAYTQALMDLGATVCTRAQPECGRCPVQGQCVALREGRVASLPAPRPRKRLPLRRATWLVLLHQGSVLLERKPDPGLWGGLWTFPELPLASTRAGDARAFSRRVLGSVVRAVRRLPVVEHGFSHFRLRALPLGCDVHSVMRLTEAPGRIWLEIGDATRAAVPAPVRGLLKGLKDLPVSG
jgi:A/G-specific adenine glycosylase